LQKPKIKICGITNLKDARLSLEAGASSLGFNFYKKSRRFVDPLEVKEIISELPSDKDYFGVFVNHSREEVASIAKAAGLTGLQFHGDEPEEILEDWSDYKVIKALRISKLPETTELKALLKKVDHILFDSYSEKEYGGTGKAIASEVLSDLKDKEILQRLFIAGGITPENIASVASLEPYAIDLASGVESENAREKSEQKVKALFKNLSSI